MEDVSVGRTWMNTMSAGASMNDMPMQLCMPMARHLLQSVEMPAVTQARNIAYKRFISIFTIKTISKVLDYSFHEANAAI